MVGILQEAAKEVRERIRIMREIRRAVGSHVKGSFELGKYRVAKDKVKPLQTGNRVGVGRMGITKSEPSELPTAEHRTVDWSKFTKTLPYVPIKPLSKSGLNPNPIMSKPAENRNRKQFNMLGHS